MHHESCDPESMTMTLEPSERAGENKKQAAWSTMAAAATRHRHCGVGHQAAEADGEEEWK